VIGDTGVAYVSSITGIFSPAARAYDIDVESGLIHPVMFTNLVEGERPQPEMLQGARRGLRGLKTPQWAMTAFSTEAVVDWPVVAEPRIERSRARLTAWLGNPLGVRVDNAVLAVAGAAAALGSLAEAQPATDPLEWRAFDTQRSEIDVGAHAPVEQIGLRVAMVARATRPSIVEAYAYGYHDVTPYEFAVPEPLDLFEPAPERPRNRPEVRRFYELLNGQPVVMGWSGEPPYALTVDGGPDAQSDTTLVYRRLSRPRVVAEQEASARATPGAGQ
jgi:hypothetical protein